MGVLGPSRALLVPWPRSLFSPEVVAMQGAVMVDPVEEVGATSTTQVLAAQVEAMQGTAPTNNSTQVLDMAVNRSAMVA
eukprot:SAG31_NODE_787_length_12094_cov_27.048270_4_plen_79_part_00